MSRRPSVAYVPPWQRSGTIGASGNVAKTSRVQTQLRRIQLFLAYFRQLVRLAILYLYPRLSRRIKVTALVWLGVVAAGMYWSLEVGLVEKTDRAHRAYRDSIREADKSCNAFLNALPPSDVLDEFDGSLPQNVLGRRPTTIKPIFYGLEESQINLRPAALKLREAALAARAAAWRLRWLGWRHRRSAWLSLVGSTRDEFAALADDCSHRSAMLDRHSAVMTVWKNCLFDLGPRVAAMQSVLQHVEPNRALAELDETDRKTFTRAVTLTRTVRKTLEQAINGIHTR